MICPHQPLMRTVAYSHERTGRQPYRATRSHAAGQPAATRARVSIAHDPKFGHPDPATRHFCVAWLIGVNIGQMCPMLEGEIPETECVPNGDNGVSRWKIWKFSMRWCARRETRACGWVPPKPRVRLSLRHIASTFPAPWSNWLPGSRWAERACHQATENEGVGALWPSGCLSCSSRQCSAAFIASEEDDTRARLFQGKTTTHRKRTHHADLSVKKRTTLRCHVTAPAWRRPPRTSGRVNLFGAAASYRRPRNPPHGDQVIQTVPRYPPRCSPSTWKDPSKSPRETLSSHAPYESGHSEQSRSAYPYPRTPALAAADVIPAVTLGPGSALASHRAK